MVQHYVDGGRYIGPEMVRLLQEFECTLPSSDKPTWLEHHDEGLSHQKAFQKHVCSLVDTITSMANPFCDDCPELVVMGKRDRAEHSIVAMARTIEERGRAQYEKFVRQRAD